MKAKVKLEEGSPASLFSLENRSGKGEARGKRQQIRSFGQRKNRAPEGDECTREKACFLGILQANLGKETAATGFGTGGEPGFFDAFILMKIFRKVLTFRKNFQFNSIHTF